MNELYLNISKNKTLENYNLFVADIKVFKSDFVTYNKVSLTQYPNLEEVMQELSVFLKDVDFENNNVYYKNILVKNTDDIKKIDSKILD